MAVAPAGCTTVIEVPGNKFPLVKAGDNIYVLPGEFELVCVMADGFDEVFAVVL